MKFEFLFAWYDFWIGAYWDRKNSWLYFLPLPTVGIIIKFPVKRLFEIDKVTGEIRGYCHKEWKDHPGADRWDYVEYWAKTGTFDTLFGYTPQIGTKWPYKKNYARADHKT